MDELKERALKTINKLGIEQKINKIKEIEDESSHQDFWQNHQLAASKMKIMTNLQKEINEAHLLEEYLREGMIEDAQKLLDKLEMLMYFSGHYDGNSAIFSIHSGQGGVEAMDWAEMLYRMYTRYFEKKGWSFEVIEEISGEEAGIKSVTMTVIGAYAYGFLKGEAGVHRLVRLSPFNADNLRQTSFALVELLPLIEDDKSPIVIKDDDIEWDFYRASSNGGQNVQKVSSAVRLKHLPSGIVVTAQAERQQGQNREDALRILRAKLWVVQEEERKKEEKRLKGGYKTPGWGNQIRSYVLHPYRMVKDLRTNHETSDTEGVLGGDLDRFIEEELRFFS
ncbi:peptide chain release factor 2 [Candidatus Levyibacteriota bacterium]|nr:peptide chain release factor 2 [Candidatus Levybacteria bacterium]GDX61725.1 peptide chain release factor 2 [Candidatus Levybacteria bacterium]